MVYLHGHSGFHGRRLIQLHEPLGNSPPLYLTCDLFSTPSTTDTNSIGRLFPQHCLRQNRFFVLVHGQKTPLTPPYQRPFAVTGRGDKVFLVDCGARKDTIAGDRLKPVYFEKTDCDSPQRNPVPAPESVLTAPTPPSRILWSLRGRQARIPAHVCRFFCHRPYVFVYFLLVCLLHFCLFHFVCLFIGSLFLLLYSWYRFIFGGEVLWFSVDLRSDITVVLAAIAPTAHVCNGLLMGIVL